MANKIQSLLATLIPFVSAGEAATMAYPPDAMPGARDVETFYGAMRVYEWGPADGEKILFVHGDATPSLVFSKIAQGLVDAGSVGSRIQRYTTGLSARRSSFCIPNTSGAHILATFLDGKRHEVLNHRAFSLGAPISFAFAAAYPSSVQSFVLLGPAGLIRKLPDGYDDQLMHQPELAASPEAIREKWQFDHHQGHIYSFQDTIRYGPLQTRELWKKVCDIIAGRARPDTALHNYKLLVFFGKDDGVVVGGETTEDILKLLPASHLQTEYVPGGHRFPYPNSDTITRTILSSWKSGLAVN
ncbi:hypothetical protein LA080_009438 [Diaporthe eres]|nr:hypothetical protein LA080_009438 [Diaporthe eres]